MKIYCLNVDSATARYESFMGGFPYKTLGCFERWRAKTPEDVTVPEWFRYRPAYYANAVNFIEMFEACAGGTENFLIFEDDCIFRPDFDTRYKEFLEEVPEDWDYLNFGPGHMQTKLFPPVQVSENILRVRFNYGTHAVMVTPKGAKKCAEQLKKEPWGCVHIPDHQLGLLFLDPDFKAYAPIVSYCGQRGGMSSLTLQNEPEKWFMNFRFKSLDGEIKIQKDPYFPEPEKES